jgi:hypothetical protein
MGNLVNNTLIPTIKEQAIQTGYMYSAQNYISGSAQAFRQTFEEQLKDGAYKVVKKTYKDTSYTTSITDSVRTIKEINTRYVVEKVMENGVPVRIPHEIVKTGIIVNQVIVDRVILDPDYQERLTKQKEESAKRQLEQQKIETAKIAQVRIKAEGERDKEMERVTQERKQVAQLIAIETELKQEKTSLELAKIQLETAKANSAKAKVKADAQYYTNTKMVQAGLTPQQKAEWEYKTKVGIAQQIKDMNVPKIITSGGGSGGNGDVNTLIQLKVLETLSKE